MILATHQDLPGAKTAEQVGTVQTATLDFPMTQCTQENNLYFETQNVKSDCLLNLLHTM
jgi:hypothetical protein